MELSPVLVFITRFTGFQDYDELFGAGESVPSSPFISPDGGVYVYCGNTHFGKAFAKGNEFAAHTVVEQLKLDFKADDYRRLKVLIHQSKIAREVQNEWAEIAVANYSSEDVILYDTCICALVRLAKIGVDYREQRMKLLHAKFGAFYPPDFRFALLRLTDQPGWLETDWTYEQHGNPLASEAWLIFERTRRNIKKDNMENCQKHLHDMNEALRAWEDTFLR